MFRSVCQRVNHAVVARSFWTHDHMHIFYGKSLRVLEVDGFVHFFATQTQFGLYKCMIISHWICMYHSWIQQHMFHAEKSDCPLNQQFGVDQCSHIGGWSYNFFPSRNTGEWEKHGKTIILEALHRCGFSKRWLSISLPMYKRWVSWSVAAIPWSF